MYEHDRKYKKPCHEKTYLHKAHMNHRLSKDKTDDSYNTEHGTG